MTAERPATSVRRTVSQFGLAAGTMLAISPRMAQPGDTPSTYTVIQFSLETGADAAPRQRTKTWGSYISVEEAFENARCLANDTSSRIRSAGAFGSPAIVDTEWGYDLRLGPLTVHRFWVHEKSARQRTLH